MKGRKSYLLHPTGLVFCLLVFPLLVLFLFSHPIKANSQSKNQCIACHTSAKKLIQITRIIKQTTPQPEKSVLTKGEG